MGPVEFSVPRPRQSAPPMRSGCRRHRRPRRRALPMLMTPTASRLLASSTPLAIGARRDHALIGEHQRAAAVGADDQAAVDLPGRAQARDRRRAHAVRRRSQPAAGAAHDRRRGLDQQRTERGIAYDQVIGVVPVHRRCHVADRHRTGQRLCGVALAAANTATSATPRERLLPRPGRARRPPATGRCLGSGRCDTRGSWALSFSCHGRRRRCRAGAYGYRGPA